MAIFHRIPQTTISLKGKIDIVVRKCTYIAQKITSEYNTEAGITEKMNDLKLMFSWVSNPFSFFKETEPAIATNIVLGKEYTYDLAPTEYITVLSGIQNIKDIFPAPASSIHPSTIPATYKSKIQEETTEIVSQFFEDFNNEVKYRSSVIMNDFFHPFYIGGDPSSAIVFEYGCYLSIFCVFFIYIYRKIRYRMNIIPHQPELLQTQTTECKPKRSSSRIRKRRLWFIENGENVFVKFF